MKVTHLNFTGRDSMINIPVTKPTELVQCGTYNTVYPPTKKKGCCEKSESGKNRERQTVQSKTITKTKGEKA